jgi:hypothetical protein
LSVTCETLGNYKFQTCVPFQLIDFWYFILLHMFFSQKFPVKFWWVWIHNFALNQKCTHTLHYLTVSWHYYNHHRLYYCLAIIVVFCVFCCHLQLPMLKLKAHSGFYDFFDSDISNSMNVGKLLTGSRLLITMVQQIYP